MPLAVSKDVQDELLAIRADLETAMVKFIRDGHYGAAERMLVIIDRSLHNLIRDAAIVAQSSDEPRVEAIVIPALRHRLGEQAEDLPHQSDADERGAHDVVGRQVTVGHRGSEHTKRVTELTQSEHRSHDGLRRLCR